MAASGNRMQPGEQGPQRGAAAHDRSADKRKSSREFHGGSTLEATHDLPRTSRPEEPRAEAALPGVRTSPRKSRRGAKAKARAAVALQVQQWEGRLLQDIEEASRHELTIQKE